MNEATNQTADAPELDEHEVAAYLIAHPEFARRHPAAFEAQEIPHDTPGTVSLIERQVAVLRQTNRDMAERFESLVATARANESRVIELNRVARIMVEARGIDPLIEALTTCLREHFAVDRVYVGLGDAPSTDASRIAAIESGGPAERALTNVFRRGKPICGPLSEDQAAALFAADEATSRPSSAAFIPLGHSGVRGAVVLASRDPSRFTSDMGTLFVELFGQLLTATLSRLIDDEL